MKGGLKGMQVIEAIGEWITKAIGKWIGIVMLILGVAALAGGIIFMVQASGVPAEVENYVSLEAANSALAASSARWWLGVEHIVLGVILMTLGFVLSWLAPRIVPLLGMVSQFLKPPQA